jgi:hypothetical protein
MEHQASTKLPDEHKAVGHTPYTCLHPLSLASNNRNKVTVMTLLHIMLVGAGMAAGAGARKLQAQKTSIGGHGGYSASSAQRVLGQVNNLNA